MIRYLDTNPLPTYTLFSILGAVFRLLERDADDDGEGTCSFIGPVLLAHYFLHSIIVLTPFYFHMGRVGPWMLSC